MCEFQTLKFARENVDYYYLNWFDVRSPHVIRLCTKPGIIVPDIVCGVHYVHTYVHFPNEMNRVVRMIKIRIRKSFSHTCNEIIE